jgi:large subunit ribosomal protein L15
MREHQLTQTHARPTAKRVGRGISAGQGKTAGRGTKGQKARTGANSNIPRLFEGGSTGLIKRLPKLKGFKSMRVKTVTVNAARIAAAYKDGEEVSIRTLLEKGLIVPAEALRGIKVVGASSGTLPKVTFADEPLLARSATLR